MNVLDHFSIPFKGLGNGSHHLKFIVDDAFFQAFEQSPLDNGNFEVDLILEKKFDHSVFDFSISGFTNTSCDRCLQDISLPVEGSYTLIIKLGEGESTDEILYVDQDISIFNVGHLVYEYICLSMPMIKTYDCENDEPRPCNFKVLDKLGHIRLDENGDKGDRSDDNPWSALQDIEF